MKLKVLAVDDDPIIRELIRHVVTSWGYADLTIAESGEQAVELVDKEARPFDCLLIDMKMAEMSGAELCSWVRKLSEYEDTPIFIVTALSEKGDIDLAFAAGASDYISKPIIPSDLTLRLNQVRRNIIRSELSASKAEKYSDLSSVGFHQPILVGGSSEEIEIDAMRNYVIRLAKSRTEDMNAFSFVIKGAAKIHSLCDHEDFLDVLKVTEGMIAKCLSKHRFFISYIGYGAFAGVVQSDIAHDPMWKDIERRVQVSLRGVKVRSPSGSPIEVIPYMSGPQQLSTWSGLNALDVLYRLVGEAEFRCGEGSMSLYSK